MTLGPLLLAGSVMAGHSTRTLLASARLGFLGAAAGALFTCTFFSILYVIVPNTKVRLRNAVAGALVAGLAWELAKWGYTLFVARSVRYHAIYGSVAAIPIFILWLYLSWAILLFGARLAFVFQYASSLIQGVHADSRIGREILGGRALLVIARAFDAGTPAPDAGEVANELGASADDVSEALGALKAAGIVVSLADGGLVPGRPLEKVTLLDVRRALGGKEPPLTTPSDLIAAVVKGAEDESAERLADVTFRSLCDRERGAGDGERPPAPTPAEQGSAQPVRSA
jgi:membrane protein